MMMSAVVAQGNFDKDRWENVHHLSSFSSILPDDFETKPTNTAREFISYLY